jgi:hypothetical protein
MHPSIMQLELTARERIDAALREAERERFLRTMNDNHRGQLRGMLSVDGLIALMAVFVPSLRPDRSESVDVLRPQEQSC